MSTGALETESKDAAQSVSSHPPDGCRRLQRQPTPALSVSWNSTALGGPSGVAFGQIANGGASSSVPSGLFAPMATGAGLSGSVQFTTVPTVEGGDTAFTLVVAGEARQGGALQPQFLLVPNYTPAILAIPAGSAAIRVVNLSLAPNPSGLYTLSNGVPSAALDTPAASLSFGYNSTTNTYVALPTAQIANLVLVDTTAPGTALSLSPASNLNTFTFLSGQAYMLYVFGQPGNAAQPLGALWVVDFPTP